MLFQILMLWIAWWGTLGLAFAWFGFRAAALAFLASVCVAWMVIVMRGTDQNDDD